MIYSKGKSPKKYVVKCVKTASCRLETRNIKLLTADCNWPKQWSRHNDHAMCPLLRKEVLWTVTKKNPRKRVRSKPRLWAFTHFLNKIICFRVIGIFPLDFIRCSAFLAMWLPTMFNLNCTEKNLHFLGSWWPIYFFCVCGKIV